jgi:hypothetical protein
MGISIYALYAKERLNSASTFDLHPEQIVGTLPLSDDGRVAR